MTDFYWEPDEDWLNEMFFEEVVCPVCGAVNLYVTPPIVCHDCGIDILPEDLEE